MTAKRICPGLTAMLLLTLLTACGGSASPSPSPSASDPAPAVDGYTYTYAGKTVVLGSPMDEVVAALGEPKSIFEETSCAFEGVDKTLFYNGVNLTTFPHNGKDYIFSIDLQDDSVQTPEGIYLGMTRQQAIAAYGENQGDQDNTLEYLKGGTKLTIIIQDNLVASIRYTLDIL